MKKSAKETELTLKDKLKPFEKELTFWGQNKYLPVEMRAFLPSLMEVMNFKDIPGCTECKHDLLNRAYNILIS